MVRAKVGDLMLASDLRLDEAIVHKQAKYLRTAGIAHHHSCELDTTLSYP